MSSAPPPRPVPDDLKNAIWKALLDAEFSALYWARRARCFQSRDKWLSIVTAVSSCSALGSWKFVLKYPDLWQGFLVITAVVSVAQPFLNYSAATEQMFQAQAKWTEFSSSYNQLWHNVTRMGEKVAWDKLHALQHSQSALASECERLPQGTEKMKLKCKADVLQARGGNRGNP